jgi:hypothetical protein
MGIYIMAAIAAVAAKTTIIGDDIVASWHHGIITSAPLTYYNRDYMPTLAFLEVLPYGTHSVCFCI